MKYSFEIQEKAIGKEREEWKDIKEYEGLYQVSNLGRVKSLDQKVSNKKGNYLQKGKVLAFYIDKDGYCVVCLTNKRKHKTYRVSRLVAETFIPNYENKPTVNHIDGNKQNNNIENLEWATYSENNRHAVEMGLNTKDKLKIKVNQYDLNGNFIKQWESLSEAGRKAVVHVTKICLCCQGKRKTTGGYIWKYEKI